MQQLYQFTWQIVDGAEVHLGYFDISSERNHMGIFFLFHTNKNNECMNEYDLNKAHTSETLVSCSLSFLLSRRR